MQRSYLSATATTMIFWLTLSGIATVALWWAARLIGMLMPQPNLWILLDASAEISQMRKQEVSPEESARQRQAYLAFIRTRSKHVIVDASQSLNKVIADVEQAITETILKTTAIVNDLGPLYKTQDKDTAPILH